MTRKIKYGYAQIFIDDAALIYEALKVLREAAPKWWKKKGLPLPMYRLEKELGRNRFSPKENHSEKERSDAVS